MRRVNAAIRLSKLVNSLDAARFAQTTGNIRSLIALRRVKFVKWLHPSKRPLANFEDKPPL